MGRDRWERKKERKKGKIGEGAKEKGSRKERIFTLIILNKRAFNL